MIGSDIIPLPHIYGARIKGVKVFCPLDPPPPYEAVVSQMDQEQVCSHLLFSILTAGGEHGTSHKGQWGDGPTHYFKFTGVPRAVS
jgi:hypothetical protein